MAATGRLAFALGSAIAIAAGCVSDTANRVNGSVSDVAVHSPPATRVAVLELGQFDGARNSRTFGFDVDAEMIATARRSLETEHPDLVIIRVDAGGGELSECLQIAFELEAIESQFRTVLLIDSVILNDALAVWSVDEIFMRPQANFGAASVWPGRPTTREYIYDLLTAVDVVATLSGQDPRLLRSMLVTGVPLSATRNGSEVEMFEDATSGDILINREGELLCFNATTAYQAGVSRGTADDVPGLLKLLGIENAQLVAGGANDELQKVARDRIATVEIMNDQTRQAWVRVRWAEQLAAAPIFDAEAFRVAYLQANSVLRRLRAIVKARPMVARYSALAYFDGQERDPNGSDGDIAKLTMILEAARVKAASLSVETPKD